jgi:hypothetical protein
MLLTSSLLLYLSEKRASSPLCCTADYRSADYYYICGTYMLFRVCELKERNVLSRGMLVGAVQDAAIVKSVLVCRQFSIEPAARMSAQ